MQGRGGQGAVKGEPCRKVPTSSIPIPIPFHSRSIPFHSRNPGGSRPRALPVGAANHQATPPSRPRTAAPTLATPTPSRPRPRANKTVAPAVATLTAPLLPALRTSQPCGSPPWPRLLCAQAAPPAPSSPPRGASRGAGTDVAASRRHLVLQGGSRPGRAGSERDPPSAARPTARGSRRRRWVC